MLTVLINPYFPARHLGELYRLAILTLLLTVLVLPSHAGPFGALLRKGDDALTGAGKQLDELVPSLEDGKWLTRQLTPTDGTNRLALVPSEGGGWRLIDGEGGVKQLDTLDDLVPSPNMTKVRQIAVREEDFFKLRQNLKEVPENTSLQLVRKSGKTHPLKSISLGKHTRLVIELDKSVLLNPTSARALDANINYLRKGFNKANLKIGAFDSKKSAKVSSKVQPSSALVSLQADQLLSSLARYKNQTLMISGRIERNAKTGARTLIVRDGPKERSLSLDDLDKASESARVNLMIVETKSTTQPGKGWIGKSDLEKRFQMAAQARTQQDLLTALAPPKSHVLIHASDNGGTRITMSTHYAMPNKKKSVSAQEGSADYSLTSWLTSAAFRSGYSSVRLNAEDPEHSEEMQGRWLPWFSNIDIILAVLGAGVYIFVSLQSWKWWRGLWRMLARKSPSEPDFSKSIRTIRLISFLPMSLLLFLPAMLWIWVRDTLAFITWPFRKTAQLFRR